MKAGIDLGFKVNVQARVMKGDKLVREYPMEHNLILDVGMEKLATTYTADVFLTACVGNGTTPTSNPSGGTTVSANGGTPNKALASAGYFDPTDVGKLLHYISTGQQAMITGFTSTTEVTIDLPGVVIGAQAVEILAVDQTQLASYVVGSSTYRNTGNSENGSQSVFDSGVDFLITRWRTFQFPDEVGTVTYTEGGWTWEDVAVTNPTLFGRIVFATPVEVNLGEHLLLYVELNTWVDCTIETIPVLPVTNLAVAAHSAVRISASLTYFSGILSTGATNNNDSTNKAAVVEPCNTSGSAGTYPAVPSALIGITDDTTALTSDAVAGSSLTTAWITLEPDAYVASSYQYIYDAFFTGVSVDLGAPPNWYDIRFSNDGSANMWDGFRILFDAVQSKTLADTVQLIFTKTWSRDLS